LAWWEGRVSGGGGGWAELKKGRDARLTAGINIKLWRARSCALLRSLDFLGPLPSAFIRLPAIPFLSLLLRRQRSAHIPYTHTHARTHARTYFFTLLYFRRDPPENSFPVPQQLDAKFRAQHVSQLGQSLGMNCIEVEPSLTALSFVEGNFDVGAMYPFSREIISATHEELFSFSCDSLSYESRHSTTDFYDDGFPFSARIAILALRKDFFFLFF
jgi:hypothetical protein